MMHKPGDVIGDRYRVDRILGQGGMGGVYQVTQLELDKSFALKELMVVVADPAVRDNAIRQFRVEARILHTLQHPGLPRLYDFFEEGGNHYLSMELIAGGTLDDYLQTSIVSERQALQWTQEICSVLHYLHTHDPPVIFRDLKPSNVMLTPMGHIKLIDFGIAKVWDAEKTPSTLTQTAIRGAGSPGFAAPEQYAGGTDERTDIYALGATIYALLTRTMPPQSVELASGRTQLPPLHAVCPDLSDILVRNVEWMMKLNLNDRPQTVAQVVAAFGWPPPSSTSPATRGSQWAGSANTRVKAPTPSAATSLPPRSPRRSWAIPVVAALCLLLLLTWRGVHSWNQHHRAAAPKAPPSYTVSFDLTPADTHLYLDGRLQPLEGPSPQLQLPPGHYSLDFSRDGYLDDTRQVAIADEPVALRVKLAPKLATLYIDTTPSGNLISIANTHRHTHRHLGKSPVTADSLIPGEDYLITVEQPGLKPATKHVVMQPGEQRPLRIKLTSEN